MDKEVLNELLRHSLNVRLLYACDTGNLQQVQSLVERGADVNYYIHANYSFETPLINAIHGNHLNVVKFLVNHGAYVNNTNRYYIEKYHIPILEASSYGTPEMLEFLIKNGADIFAVGGFGNNALIKSNSQNIKFLLDIGFKDLINYQNKEGTTALHNIDDYNSVKLLLEYGANPNIKDNGGKTSLSVHMLSGYKIIKLLLEYGADPLIKDRYGNTPLQFLIGEHSAEGSGLTDQEVKEIKELMKSYVAKRPLEPLLMSLYKTKPNDYKGLPKDLLRRTGEFLHQFSKRSQRKSRKKSKKSRKIINKRKSKRNYNVL